MPQKKEKSINLYWVQTEDHSEDWFIFASTARAAGGFHEDYEGYEARDASARLVIEKVELQKFENGTPPCHAQIPDLQALGFEILTNLDSKMRIVRLNGEQFVEGEMETLVAVATDNALESAGMPRLNGTPRPGKPN
jgi:hypothetical protein